MIESKHIFAGNTRLATKMEKRKGTGAPTDLGLYYYHGDHLGSSNAITNGSGNFHEHVEYFPYGETWVEERVAGGENMPHKFTGKELDPETGLYYYGHRYFDPKLSRWTAADPPMSTGEYFPVPPVNQSAKERNADLPGMGGVFNSINLDAYHYAGDNPVKLLDPDGNVTVQIGWSRTFSAFLGTSVENGIVAGFSLKNGIEWGTYKVEPKNMVLKVSGSHTDAGVSTALNISFSLAEGINELSGDSISTGMTVDAGTAAFVSGVMIQGGGAFNIPLDLKSPKSITGSLGISGSLSPIDTFAQTSKTTVTKMSSEIKSNGSGYLTNLVKNAVPKVIFDSKKK